MKKSTLLKSLLILLPVLAVVLATTTDSVMVFDAQTGVTEYYAYFDVLPVETFAMVPALAATLSMVCCVLGVVYMVNKKEWCVKGSLWLSLISACAAVAPIVMQTAIRVVPNVGLPIFMMANCLIANTLLKSKEKEEKKANRLQ